ncbi:microviridin/marinostatin family tricyclic proteinase inhibitor [Sorangium sp. So ce124]|uniref:microviridin/marinostatin family tricyclic proteinase inhibitor n=1 Tax=Sorangium sp. So ce124 TaxID=3133280 RepID=UPI003F5E7065
MADIDRDHEQNEQSEQEEQTETVPFFARYLEDQKRIRTGVKAGGIYQTLKYPSDRDEDVTLKYPSDGDEELALK